MNFSKDLNSTYIMSHYFHDKDKFNEIQGSISKKKFHQIVKKNLYKNYIYTFDDSLKSQYYIAKRILDKYSLKGIFFLNTFQFEKIYNFNEISKFYVKKFYKNKNFFYRDFLKKIKKKIKFNSKDIKEIKAGHPFYDIDEIKIRIVRLKNINLYNKILKVMFLSKKFNYKAYQKKIYMNKKEIYELSKKHIIGLHTHSHPFNFHKLNEKEQYYEVKKNKTILEKIIKDKVKVISYPIGNFNNKTIKVLKKLKITHGFIANISNKKSHYKISRLNINKL